MGKIIITGPGRSGTTFLVMLLTRLGYDTGFKPYKETYVEEIRAGCEHAEPDLENIEGVSLEELKERTKKAPKILKAPAYSYNLKRLVQSGVMKVDWVIVPVRDLRETAESRLSVGLRWLTDKGEKQQRVLAWVLGKTIEACVVCRLPCKILRFPEIVVDWKYCYNKLNPIFKFKDKEKFKKKFKELSKPGRIKHGKDKQKNKKTS